MNTRFLSCVAVALFAATASVAQTVETNAPAAAITADARLDYLLTKLPPGLNPIGVEWVGTNGVAKVQFRLTVVSDQPRFQRYPFFPAKSEGAVEALRTALVEAGQPIEYQKQSLQAGAELIVTGSFFRRLDGIFSPVVWGPEMDSKEGEDSRLPKDDSDYSRQMRSKIAEAKRARVISDVNGFVRTLGSRSGHVAAVTGNQEAAKVADVARRITGEQMTNNPSASGTTNSTAGAAAELPTDLGQAAKQAENLVRGLGNLFGK